MDSSISALQSLLLLLDIQKKRAHRSQLKFVFTIFSEWAHVDPDILFNQLKDLRLVGNTAGVTDTISIQCYYVN